MKTNDYKTFVPMNLIQNPDSTGMDIMSYNTLVMYGSNYFNESIYVTPIFVAGHVGNMKKATESLAFLSNQYPKLLEKTKRHNAYKFNISHKISKGTVKVYYWEIETILNSEYSFKLELIKLFYLIVSSFKPNIENYKGTNCSSIWYANYMNVTLKTISLYMSCLKKLKLIFLFQDKARKPNLIGRYEDKNSLWDWALHNGYTGGSRSSANEARSLMMKYHQLEKGRKYSTNEVQQIKEYISWYNSNCEPGNEKDMSIFDCYLT